MNWIGAERLEALLAAIARTRVLLIGDLCLDAYWYADMTRSELSRETPRFPLPVIREAYSPGGAANVAANLAALGVGRVQALGVLGHDWRGDLLARELAARAIDLTYVLRSSQRTTPTYIKPIRQGYGGVQQEDSRIDFQDPTPLPSDLEDGVIAALADAFPQAQAVVVGDQLDPGLVTPRVRAALEALAAHHPNVPCVVDSRKHIGAFQKMILKPNELELARALGAAQPDASDMEAASGMGQTLAQRSGRPCFVTHAAPSSATPTVPFTCRRLPCGLLSTSWEREMPFSPPWAPRWALELPMRRRAPLATWRRRSSWRSCSRPGRRRPTKCESAWRWRANRLRLPRFPLRRYHEGSRRGKAR